MLRVEMLLKSVVVGFSIWLAVESDSVDCIAADEHAITLKTPSHYTSTGVSISVIETATIKRDVAITGVTHRVEQIGLFHRKLERFILCDDISEVFVSPSDKSVPGLPRAVISPHGVMLEQRADGKCGLTFSPRFLEPGVFAVTTRWTGIQRDPAVTRQLTSAPLIIFVKPGAQYETDARDRIIAKAATLAIDFQKQLESHFDSHRDNDDFCYLVLPALDP